MISQCPHCKKRFLVNKKQTTQANGLVRCGSCMKPFQVQTNETKPEALNLLHNLAQPLNTGQTANSKTQPDTKQSINSPFSVSRRLRDDGRVEPLIPNVNPGISIDSLSNQLNPEPVNLLSQSQHKVPSLAFVKPFIAFVLVLLLALILGLQLVPLNSTRFTENTTIHKFYTLSCDILKCGKKIKKEAYVSRKLIVYSHPQKPDVLTIESVIVNLSEQSLPFPLVHFQFSNRYNQIIAQRTFSEDDYLKGELSGKQLFEPSSPIRIALDIKDPGEDAVNYEMTLLPPS